MNRSLRVARCINGAYSNGKLLEGEVYTVQDGEFFCDVRYLKVYQIDMSEWGNLDGFEPGERGVWMLKVGWERESLGEFTPYRFEVLHTKTDLLAEAEKQKGREAFTKSKI